MRTAALDYASRGWRVIPLWPIRNGQCACGTDCGGSAGKHPLTQLTPNGLRNATTDRETIDRWWSQWADAGVAVVTGRGSGLVVVDIDVKDGAGGEANLKELQALHDALPATLTAATRSGGRHLYFQYPDLPIRNSAGKLGQGLDIRGDGGYVVAPPTPGYEWANEGMEPAPMPGWLVDALSTLNTSRPARVADALRGYVKGQRNDMLWRQACYLRRQGETLAGAEAAIRVYAAQTVPPFEEEVALDQVRRAYRNYGREYANTDAGNADRFVEMFGDKVRYSETGRWYIWDGQHWEEDYLGQAINLFRLAAQQVRIEAEEMPEATEAQEDAKRAKFKHWARSEQYERLVAAMKLAERDPAVIVPVRELDNDPWLFNCANGTLDLRMGQLGKHQREDMITKVAPVVYDPDAKAARWEKFLERVQPDPEVRAFLQRAAGYSLTGLTHEQCLFFLWGGGANGKSTFINVLRRLMGKGYATLAPADLFLSTHNPQHPTGIASLMGARFVSTIELDEGRAMAESLVKRITGEDGMKARYMGRDFFEFEPACKIWIGANHKPSIRGIGHGIMRRIHLVPFTIQIPEEEQVKGLADQLVVEEAAGVFNWLLDGCKEWQRIGLNPPATVRAATAEYRDEQDFVKQFLKVAVERTTVRIAGGKAPSIPAANLYASYVGFCKQSGEKWLSQRQLYGKLLDQGLEAETGAKNQNYWQAVKFTDPGNSYFELGLWVLSGDNIMPGLMGTRTS